jgi:hypothetical protein
MLLGPQSCALVGFLDIVATVTAECYCGAAIGCGRPCVAKSLGSCTKTSYFFTITPGTTLPVGFVTRYVTLAGWVWAVHSTVLIWSFFLSISLDPSDITWLATSDFQQTPIEQAVTYWLQM